jgi:hypothetical protein
MRVNNKVKKKLSMNQFAKHAKEPLKKYANRMLRRGERRDIRREQDSDIPGIDGQEGDATSKVRSA